MSYFITSTWEFLRKLLCSCSLLIKFKEEILCCFLPLCVHNFVGDKFTSVYDILSFVYNEDGELDALQVLPVLLVCMGSRWYTEIWENIGF